MRRLRNSRAPEPDELAIEGFDRMELEGDAIEPVADEIPWLRPFGADVPGPVIPLGDGDAEPESVSVPRQAFELAELGRRLDAVLLLRRYLDDTPQDAGVRAQLAALLDQQGEAEAALDELGRALLDATDPVVILVMRGDLLARVGRTAEAERELRDAIRRRPEYAPAHFHLGLALHRRGLGAEAAEAFRTALTCAPGDPEATYYLGEALQAQGELPAALQALERAAALAPADPRSYKLMGRVLDRMGRTDEAMAMHKKAREVTIR
jgi:Flp pilus assembly protein TadD